MSKNIIQIDKSKIQAGLDFLKRIQLDFPGAMIAGGYLRDAYFGVVSKDIDVFIPYVEKEYVETRMVAYGAREMHGCAYMPQSEITRVWDVITHGVPGQVIMLQARLDLEERIKGYDFGFCQIWTDGNEVYCTDEFLKDALDNTCTLVVCEDHTQFLRSMRRFDRFKIKYPSRTLKIKEGINFLEDDHVKPVDNTALNW